MVECKSGGLSGIFQSAVLSPSADPAGSGLKCKQTFDRVSGVTCVSSVTQQLVVSTPELSLESHCRDVFCGLLLRHLLSPTINTRGSAG